MKTNFALTLDSGLLKEIRTLCAKERRSVSALVTDLLERIVRERKGYEMARQRALARLRKGIRLQWTPHKSRSKLYER